MLRHVVIIKPSGMVMKLLAFEVIKYGLWRFFHDEIGFGVYERNFVKNKGQSVVTHYPTDWR